MNRRLFVVVLISLAALTSAAYRRLRSDAILVRTGLRAFDEGRMVEAATQLDRVGARDASSPAVQVRLAEALLATGRPQEAARAAGRVLSSPRESSLASEIRVDALRIMGVVAESRADFEGASTWYTRALELRPRDRALRIRQARSLTWSGRFSEAAAAYRSVLEENP